MIRDVDDDHDDHDDDDDDDDDDIRYYTLTLWACGTCSYAQGCHDTAATAQETRNYQLSLLKWSWTEYLRVSITSHRKQ